MIDGISIGIKLPTVASFLYVNILVDMIIKIKNKKILVDILIEKSISLMPIYKHAFITCSLILKHVYFHIHTRTHTEWPLHKFGWIYDLAMVLFCSMLQMKGFDWKNCVRR